MTQDTAQTKMKAFHVTRCSVKVTSSLPYKTALIGPETTDALNIYLNLWPNVSASYITQMP